MMVYMESSALKQKTIDEHFEHVRFGFTRAPKKMTH